MMKEIRTEMYVTIFGEINKSTKKWKKKLVNPYLAGSRSSA